MKRLFIFNPETEFALASDLSYYTPPKRICALRAANALLPTLMAKAGDAILLLDNLSNEKLTELEHYSRCESVGIEILRLTDMKDWSGYLAQPWGWNRQIARFLSEKCPGINGIPSESEITVLRELSHRRTAGLFIDVLPQSMRNGIATPIELQDTTEAIEYYRQNPDIFLKAPWSSSGRGVMRTDDLEPRHVEPWIRGTIRAQGSVIAEPIYNKTIDFATEWRYNNGHADYIGLSVFEASGRGKYHRNFNGSQAELLEMIRSAAPKFSTETIEAQKEGLQTIIGKTYNGPLGIDMLVTPEGYVHPCVEINFRHTMGSILINNKI